jgi:hypothetical protein
MTRAAALARARAAKVNALAPDLAAAPCGPDHMTVRYDALLTALEGREAAIRVAVALESELAAGGAVAG